MTSPNETTRRRHIVVNADDFGMSSYVNEAILRAFDKCLVSSATIMPNMPAFEEACVLVHRHGLQRRIGLHLNFTTRRPLTSDVAGCRRLCDRYGNWRARRTVLSLSGDEGLALEAEIAAQVDACVRNGFTPTHWDSHHHMHTELGIAPVVIRVAKRLKVGALRLGINCGPGRDGASASHRILANAYRSLYNSRLKINHLAGTEYFGDPRDTVDIIRTTRADTEVMVHPTLDNCGRLVDGDGNDLTSRMGGLHIPPAEMSSYYDLRPF
jgi:chitin disaccharide deacetylase